MTLRPLFPCRQKKPWHRWIYKVKFLADGTLHRYKARLVAKGYTQQEGVDYLETFSLVAKLLSIKVLLALSTIRNWTLM